MPLENQIASVNSSFLIGRYLPWSAAGFVLVNSYVRSSCRKVDNMWKRTTMQSYPFSCYRIDHIDVFSTQPGAAGSSTQSEFFMFRWLCHHSYWQSLSFYSLIYLYAPKSTIERHFGQKFVSWHPPTFASDMCKGHKMISWETPSPQSFKHKCAFRVSYLEKLQPCSSITFFLTVEGSLTEPRRWEREGGRIQNLY